MLSELPDQSLAYDVLTKRPRNMEETINLVTWHLTCKYGMRGKFQIRMVETNEDQQEVEYEDLNCRKAGHQRYVEAGTIGEVSPLEMSDVNAESADFHLSVLEIRSEDDEDAESADFNIDLLFEESEIQKGNKEQLQKDLSPLNPVRETKIVERMEMEKVYYLLHVLRKQELSFSNVLKTASQENSQHQQQ
ncbi:unnamed protein product [Mytilus coruscus]|uniref:Uncharacterized protein n=1 Tax=Mytilus coruscus TaxID=42192 RepID=A0A6J8EFD7_MYTCO|nr:unnamed protein product [Mytilus coruscus]